MDRLTDIAIRDLDPLEDAAHRRPRKHLQALTDEELLDSARNPKNGAFLTVNTRSGKLHDGNGRAHELKRRAADPNSKITLGDTVPVDFYTPDLSMFPDLD